MGAGRLSVKTGGKGDAGGHAEYIDDVDAPAPSPWARVSKPKRDDIVARGSGNMPRWAITPAMFWRASDEYERVGGTTYREMEILLPRELRPAQRLALLAEWIEQELGSKHAYQYAVHCPLALDGEEQPHAHLMFSERQVDGIERDPDVYFKRVNSKNPERGGCRKGFGPRAGETLTYDERRAELVALRARWEVMCNAHLAAAGVEARIDMRSYADRGLLDEEGMGPERKLSPIEARDPEVIADLLDYRAARNEYLEAKAAAEAVVVEMASRRKLPTVIPDEAPPAPTRRSKRSARELEQLIGEAERKLAELEARKRGREQAEAAYLAARAPAELARRAILGLQGSLFARAAAVLGLGPLARAQRAMQPLETRFKAAWDARDRSAAALAAAEQAAGGLPDLVQLRDELAAVREYDARDARSVDLVIGMVARLDSALEAGDDRRGDWRTLQAVDQGRLIRWDLRDPYEPLRQLLAAEPDTRVAIATELSARRAEIEDMEREIRPERPQLGYDQAPGA